MSGRKGVPCQEGWLKDKGREVNSEGCPAGLSRNKGNALGGGSWGREGECPGHRAQVSVWGWGPMTPHPACGRNFPEPALLLTHQGGLRSDLPVMGGMQGWDDLAEGFRRVLNFEQEICLNDRLSSCVLEKGPFLSRCKWIRQAK